MIMVYRWPKPEGGWEWRRMRWVIWWETGESLLARAWSGNPW